MLILVCQDRKYMLEAVVESGSSNLGTTDVPSGTPVAFGLRLAPNPVSRTAKLTVNLESASKVNLSVYDLSGRKVADIMNDTKSAGQHEVSLDVSGMASGLYIVHLSSGNHSAVKRTVVAR